MPQTVGLTLGKFAPLHSGHQHVIETALRENDRVIVLVYNAPVTNVPLPVRGSWIRRLFPAVEVIEAPDGPTEVGASPALMREHERYILKKLAGTRISNFYSSEFYGDHVSRALGARDRRVDPGRDLFRVSGTRIRESPYVWRSFIHPVVYRDLITSVVFVGAPSTGKTTIAAALAERYATAWMPEYGREYWDKHQVDRRLTLEQLVEIAEGHREREELRILEANRFLFVDTDATTTFIFSRYYHGCALPRLAELADAALRRYDLVFLCGDEIPYSDTADRSGQANRTLMQQWIRDDLERRGRAHITLRGTLQQRIDAVASALDHYDKYATTVDR